MNHTKLEIYVTFKSILDLEIYFYCPSMSVFKFLKIYKLRVT